MATQAAARGSRHRAGLLPRSRGSHRQQTVDDGEVIHLLGHARYCRTMGDREKAAGIATVALAKLEATERGGRAGFGEIEAALRALSR